MRDTPITGAARLAAQRWITQWDAHIAAGRADHIQNETARESLRAALATIADLELVTRQLTCEGCGYPLDEERPARLRGDGCDCEPARAMLAAIALPDAEGSR